MYYINFVTLTVPFFLPTVSGKPYGDDNNDLYANDDYEELETSDAASTSSNGGAEHVIHVLPKFVTTPQNVMVNEGATIKLPCLVNRLGKKNYPIGDL
jgi:hypothetical protein